MHPLAPLFALTATLLATPASAQVFDEPLDACVLCDAGGFALVPDDPGDDWCAQAGWYGDGICDADCPQPDSDCEAAPLTGGESAPPSDDDWCAQEGWYGDGICDADCPQPDPDCA